MEWKCAQKFWIIFKDNLLSSSAKNYPAVQEEGISAEYLIGYRSIFLMKPDAKREHSRDGREAQYPFPERAGQWDCNTAVCDSCLDWGNPQCLEKILHLIYL